MYQGCTGSYHTFPYSIIPVGLPNPYSCIFSLTKSLFAKSEKDEGKGKPQKKAEKQKKKKKPKISESGAKHYRQREQVIYSITELSYGKCHEYYRCYVYAICLYSPTINYSG